MIPTKNNRRTIEACVISTVGQGGDIEVVVVDNGSIDGTPQLAADAGAHLVLHAGPERSAQRNRGHEASTGEVVVFIDSDMVVERGVAEDLRAAFGPDDVAAAVLPETAFGEGYLAGCRALEKRLYLGHPGREAARAFRATVLDRVGGYDERFFGFEDYELADRVAAAGGRTVRAVAGVRHDEGHVSLRDLWAKKQYYGTQWANLGARRLAATWLWRVPARPLLFLSDLGRVPGLVALKAVDLGGLAVGAVRSRRGRPSLAGLSPGGPTRRERVA